MLVEKKSWKNLIKPVILSIAVIVAIMSLVKIGLFICDYDSGKYAFLEVPIFIALFFIIVKIENEKIDFGQVVKVEDLSTLNNDELLDYEFELWNYSNAEAEYQRVQNEIDKRHIGDNQHITIEIQNERKKYFSDIMKYINDSNVIPSRIKESLKEDILKTYTKDHPLGERFTTSKENAAVFNAAFNEVMTVNQGYGDYGFVYEYENWKWQYGKEKK